MNEILKQQIMQILKTGARFKVNGVLERDFPESFSSVVFMREEHHKEENEIKVIFENYFITGFPGFDFHDKWNNGVAPYDKVMYGKILKETERMYFFELHSETSSRTWAGWCPKKSCSIKKS